MVSEKTDGINFWEVLNTAATALQKAVHSETAVYDAFREQLIRLGLQGSVNWLDEAGTTLTLTTVVLAPRMMRILKRFELVAGDTAEGFKFPMDLMAPVAQVIKKGEAVFVPDNTPLLITILPKRAHPFLKQFVTAFGRMPGVIAPLMHEGNVRGILYLVDPHMVANDCTAVTALAHHLAIAVENARLFQQMRHNEENLRILAENVPGVIYQCANNYTFDMLYLNNAVETLTGYPKEGFLKGEISFRDLYHPDDSPHIRPAEDTRFREMGTFHHIYRLRHRSGAWRWVEELGTGVFNEAGELLFLEGSITDITERRQAEMLQSTLYRIATVANADLTLDQLYEAIHAILGDLMDVRNFYIALVDDESKLLHLPYFVDEKDTYDGLPFNGEGGLTDYVLQRGQPQLLSRWDLKRLEQADMIGIIGTKPEVWLGVPLRTQSQVFGAMVVQSYEDASMYTEREKQLLFFVSGQVAAAIERKRAEEQMYVMAAKLAEQARMFEAILSTTPDQYVVYDRDGRIIFISPAMLPDLTLSPDEIIGKTFRELAFLPEAILQQHERDREQVVRTGQAVHGEVQVPGVQGMRDLEYILSPIKDEKGEVTAVVSATRDITQRNKTKAALHHAQKTESLGILAGGVAHDFNNLLVGMMAQTSLALAKLPPSSLAVAHLQKALRSAERAAVLTKQMLAYSGQGHFTSQPINLNDLLQDNLHLLHVTIGSRIRLELCLADALPFMQGDPGQIQQIMMNLVLNGSEAIGDHHGVVTLTTSLRMISEADEAYWQVTNAPLPPGHYVCLAVNDDGVGIDEAALNRIFEPFFTTKFTGRGLGLAAVLGIVRGHQGGLRVSSVPGVGTTFEILFPVSVAQVDTDLPHQDLPVLATGLVLVIDDEQPVREAVRDILALEGIEVLTAVNGEKGVAAYRQHQKQVSLVLLDLSLPDVRGEIVFSQLQEINPDVRVILSSGYNEREALQGFEQGLVSFLQKPYPLNALVQAVSKHLLTPEL